MSVDATVARVAQLEAMLGLSPAGAPVGTPQTTTGTTPAGRSSFAAQLASVASSTPARAVADPSPTAGATTTPGATAAKGANTPYAAEIDAAAAKYDVDPALLRGLTQLMPGTAAALGVDASVPAQAIEGGAKYLRQQLDTFGNDPAKALAAYNAGPGAVQRYGGVPPFAETQNYVRKVLAYAAEYRQAAPAATAGAAAVTSPARTVSSPASELPYSTT